MMSFDVIHLCNFTFLVSCVSAELFMKIAKKRFVESVRPQFRIVGGESADILDYPFVISIQRRYGHHVCGGSYILPRFVLSAAHCMIIKTNGRWVKHNPHRFTAIGGATVVRSLFGNTMQIRYINMILPHPEYDSASMFNDIGLFKLDRPFTTNRFLNPSPTPSSYDEKLFKVNQPLCTVIGWGRLDHKTYAGSGDALRSVEVPLTTPDFCRRNVDHRLQPEKQLCAGWKEGGKDACQGDSGGPLICNELQVGVVSWGRKCALPYQPGIYSRVDYYLDWINETRMRNDARCITSNHSNLMFILFILYLSLCMITPYQP